MIWFTNELIMATMGQLSTLQVNTPWLDQDNAMAI